MRLTERETRVIRESVERHFGRNAVVRLFGSRVDDSKRGGDIDLFIETSLDDREVAMRRIRMLAHLMRELGERKIDLVVDNGRSHLPIHDVARASGVRL